MSCWNIDYLRNWIRDTGFIQTFYRNESGQYPYVSVSKGQVDLIGYMNII